MNISSLFVSCLFQGKYFVNDIDYNSLAQMIPVRVLSGRYKIEIKVYYKSKRIMFISVVVMVKSKTTEEATTALVKKQRHN